MKNSSVCADLIRQRNVHEEDEVPCRECAIFFSLIMMNPNSTIFVSCEIAEGLMLDLMIARLLTGLTFNSICFAPGCLSHLDSYSSFLTGGKIDRACKGNRLSCKKHQPSNCHAKEEPTERKVAGDTLGDV